MTTPPDDGSMQKFPTFEGKDLDGNTVKSDELFSANAVTVVNFWFTTCNPCVGELSELDALNEELAKKGGALIGVNTFTLDGDEAAISEAKDVLAKKGRDLPECVFRFRRRGGKVHYNIFAYPTTYVVDRNGNIVGDPIVGAITEKEAGGDAAKAHRPGSCRRYGLTNEFIFSEEEGYTMYRRVLPLLLTAVLLLSGCTARAEKYAAENGREGNGPDSPLICPTRDLVLIMSYIWRAAASGAWNS